MFVWEGNVEHTMLHCSSADTLWNHTDTHPPPPCRLTSFTTHTICLSMCLSLSFLPPGSVRPCHRSLCAHNQSVDPTSALSLLTKHSHDMVFLSHDALLFLTHLRANWAQMQQHNKELADKDKSLCSAKGMVMASLLCLTAGLIEADITSTAKQISLPLSLSHTQLAAVEC